MTMESRQQANGLHRISDVKSWLSHACKAILDNVSEAKAPIQFRDSVHSSTNSQNAGLGLERCCRAGPSSRCTCCSHACSVKPLKHAWRFEVEISELISAPGSCFRKPETKKHSKGEHSSIRKWLLQETTCHTSLLSMQLKGAPDAGLPVVGLLDGLVDVNVNRFWTCLVCVLRASGQQIHKFNQHCEPLPGLRQRHASVQSN